MEEQIKIVKGNITGKDSTYIRRGTGNIEFDSNTHKILLDGVNYSGDTLIETTYSELRGLRDNKLLIPGCWYRITDYTCTTTQENTRAVHNNFDIVVLALSNDTLSEEARAIMHLESQSDGYFSNSKLEAWKILYCLDNDNTRFGWAQNKELLYSVNSCLNAGSPLKRCPSFDRNPDREFANYLYAWGTDADVEDSDPSNFIYSEKETIAIGDDLYDPGEWNNSTNYIFESPSNSTNGHGVVYRLIDEYNNDCPYDFKNIQFKRKLTDGKYDPDNGEDTWVYTFNIIIDEICQDASVIGNTLTTDEQSVFGIYGNKMGICGLYEYDSGIDTNSFITRLNDNVFLTYYQPGEYYSCHDNTFENECYGNTLANGCNKNTFGHKNLQNVLNYHCESNVFKNSCVNNVLGNYCNYNVFESWCTDNVLGDFSSDNVFGVLCLHNKLGDRCNDNIFLNYCYRIIFGNSSSIKGSYIYVTIESGNRCIYLDKSHNNVIKNITIAQGVNNTLTYKTITHTTNDSFQTIYRPANSQIISIQS